MNHSQSALLIFACRRALCLIAALLLSGWCGWTHAQPARIPQLPWDDPQAMFDQFFGGHQELDEQVLKKIEVTAQEEQRIGKRTFEAYVAYLRQQGIRIVARGEDVDYLGALVAKMRPMLTNGDRYPSLQIYLAVSDRCDARSFPGGYLVFYRGLLDTAENEAAVIGIVGHELSHLDRGHHTRRIQEMKLAEQTFSGQGQPRSMQEFFSKGSVLMRNWLRPFRPEYEREADLDGARWSFQAGYDCREMGRLFLGLQQRQQIPAIALPEFLRSHPVGAERHRAIMDEYAKLQANAPNAGPHIGAENLRRRTAWQGPP
jgi:predicted Zn-dependent protease